MKTNKNIIIDFKLSRSFILLAFLLNIFSFSGFAGNFLSKENKIIQTEVVISTLSKTKKTLYIIEVFLPMHLGIPHLQFLKNLFLNSTG